MLPARLAALLGASGILCAAWGAHGLESHAVEGGMRWWAIGAALQLATAPVLLILACFPATRARTLSTTFLSVGVALFCGTLYAMALGAPRWLGAITPLGGICLFIGWLAVAFVASRQRANAS